MKTRCGLLGILIGLTLFGTNVSAQLAEALTLFEAGQPQQLLQTIGSNSPDYNVAQCYRALCLYALGDKKGFWKALDSPEVRNAIPVEIKEEVWFKQVDAFLCCGKFESLFLKIQEFQSSFPSSIRMPAVEQYRLAGWFDCGRKKARDAFHNQDGFDRHWQVAKTNLEQFLTMAVGLTNYTALPERALKEDVWVARMLLGQEDAVFGEVQDRTEREKLSLLRLELRVDLKREEVDENLQRLAGFLNEFPNPTNRELLDKTAAILNFRKGRQLTLSGQTVEARQYFEAQRAIADADAGMREDYLYSLFLEKNFDTLTTLTTNIIAQTTPGDLDWILAKLFDGVRLAGQNQSGEAIQVLDEVLAFGFTDDKAHDRLILNAVKWRIHLALTAGDRQKAKTLVRWVQQSDCPKHYKLPFLKDYAILIPERSGL